MTKKVTAAISVLLSLVMATFVFAEPAKNIMAGAASSGTVKYVSLGDSMSTGYGIEDKGQELENDGYLCTIEKAYPALVRNYIQEKTGKTVEHTQLAVDGMRIDDIRYVLERGSKNAYEGDDLTVTYCDYSDPAVYGLYQSAIAEADYITMGLGFNNIVRSIITQLGSAFSGEFSGEAEFNPYLDKLVYGDKVWLQDFVQSTYTSVRSAFLSVLNAMPVDLSVVGEYLPMVEKAAGLFAYGIVSFVVNYRIVLDEITAINPDVTLVLFGLPNVLRDVKFALPLGNNVTVNLDAGDILALLSSQFNYYIAYLASIYNVKSQLSFKYSYKIRYTEINSIDTVGKYFRNEVSEVNRSILMREVYNNYMGALVSANEAQFASFADKVKFTSEVDVDMYAEYEKYCNDQPTTLNKDVDKNEMFTMAVYKAFEGAIARSAELNCVNVNGISAFLSGVGSLFETDAIAKVFSKENVDLAVDVGEYEHNITIPLQNELCKNKDLMSYLYMMEVIMFSDSRGIHPSVEGHATCAKAIERALGLGGSIVASPVVYLMVKPVITPDLFMWRSIEIGNNTTTLVLYRVRIEALNFGTNVAENAIDAVISFVEDLKGSLVLSAELNAVSEQQLLQMIEQDMAMVTADNTVVQAPVVTVVEGSGNVTVMAIVAVCAVLAAGLFVSIRRYYKA